MNIYEKLQKIQQELKAPKGQYNNFGKYSYRSCEDIFETVKPLLNKYDLILTTTDELQYIGDRYYIKATAKLIDTKQPYEDFDECKAINCITNIAYAREEETKKGMDGSQITGASSSYARKYALNGLFLIDDTKDSDTTNQEEEEITEAKAKEYKFAKGKHQGKSILEIAEEDDGYLQWTLDNGKDERVKQMITILTGLMPTQIPSEEDQTKKLELLNKMNKLIDETNSDYEKLLAHYKVKSNANMTIEQLEDAVSVLEKKLCM